MRCALTGAVVAVCLLFSNTVISGEQGTPDGETPAQESVCDPLKEPGVTSGLYGLCLAFCEAQDFATLSIPVTEEELEALAAAAPSGRLLDRYNRMKQDADPDMPCILIDDPCPCWSADELATIDGLAPGGIGIPLVCTNQPNDAGVLEIENAEPLVIHRAFASDFFQKVCVYIDQISVPNIHRTAFENDGTLTPLQYEECRAQVLTHCDSLGL